MSRYSIGVRAAAAAVRAFYRESAVRFKAGDKEEIIVMERLDDLIKVIEALAKNTEDIFHQEPEETRAILDAATRTRFGVSGDDYMKIRSGKQGFPHGWNDEDIAQVESLVPLIAGGPTGGPTNAPQEKA